MATASTDPATVGVSGGTPPTVIFIKKKTHQRDQRGLVSLRRKHHASKSAVTCLGFPIYLHIRLPSPWQIVNLSKSFFSTWVSCCTLKVLAWRCLGVCRGGAAWMFLLDYRSSRTGGCQYPNKTGVSCFIFTIAASFFFFMHLTAGTCLNSRLLAMW